MDPGELYAPHHIACCHPSALPLLPLKMRPGSGTELPCAQGGCAVGGHRHWGDMPPMAQRVPVGSVALLHPLASCSERGQLLPRGPVAGTCFCTNSGAGVLIRCQRCLSLGLSLLSQALRANIPGIFVMFGSIQHPSEEKKNQIKENPVLPLLPLAFFYT